MIVALRTMQTFQHSFQNGVTGNDVINLSAFRILDLVIFFTISKTRD